VVAHLATLVVYAGVLIFYVTERIEIFTPTAAGHTPERRSDTFTSVYPRARRPVTTGSTTSAVTGALAFVM
jgi:hypothetical protein